MDDLYYFPSLDILIKVIYARDANSIRYATHRSTSADEKKTLERYILQEIAPLTDYYKRTPSLLLYMGVDTMLRKELRKYQVKDTIRGVINHKLDIEEKVQSLISHSLSNYYFERLGEKLLHLRHLLENKGNPEEIEKLIEKIDTLLQAYNQNAGQNIQLESILPQEAKKFFLIGD